MQSSISLTEGPIGRGLLRFALPILYTNVLQSLNASVNSIWVGRTLGAAALAATSNANIVMFMLTSAGLGIAMAASIAVARDVGAGKMLAAKRVIGTGATFFTAASIAMAIAGLVLSKPLLLALGAPEDSLTPAVEYMRVIFLALPFLYVYLFVVSVLRGVGDSKTPFYFSLLSVAIDIVLNPVFIFGAGPVPRLGIAGSALATVVAQTISLVALVYNLYRRRHALALNNNELAMLRVDLTIVGVLLRKGIPMSADMLVISSSGVVMIALVNRFGVDTTAAFGASMQLWAYAVMPAAALGMGISAMAAQNVGAHKWERVRLIAHVGMLYGALVTSSLVLLMETVSTPAYGLFLPAGSAALHIGVHINRIVSPSFILFNVPMALFGIVRTTGAVLAPLMVLTVELFGIRLPFATALLAKWQADAIWWSISISTVIASVLACLCYHYGGWRSALSTKAADNAP